MNEAAAKYETGTETGTGTEKKKIDLQTILLRKNLGNQVTVFMINGIRLDGMLTGHDKYCITMDYHTLCYKHAISTILPGGIKTKNPKNRQS